MDCARFAPPSSAARAAARAALDLRADQTVIVAVGALVPRKGHRVLLDAMALAREEEDAAGAKGARRVLLVAGDGPLAEPLRQYAHDRGLDSAVRLLGRVDDPRQVLYAADLFAMPSANEGLGVAALEAMACGLPAVLSAVGGLREVAEDGVSGVYLPPDDAAAWAATLDRLAASPDTRAAMGRQARTRILLNFSMEAMTTKTLEFYKELMASRRRFRDDHRDQRCGA